MEPAFPSSGGGFRAPCGCRGSSNRRRQAPGAPSLRARYPPWASLHTAAPCSGGCSAPRARRPLAHKPGQGAEAPHSRRRQERRKAGSCGGGGSPWRPPGSAALGLRALRCPPAGPAQRSPAAQKPPPARVPYPVLAAGAGRAAVLAAAGDEEGGSRRCRLLPRLLLLKPAAKFHHAPPRPAGWPTGRGPSSRAGARPRTPGRTAAFPCCPGSGSPTAGQEPTRRPRNPGSVTFPGPL